MRARAWLVALWVTLLCSVDAGADERVIEQLDIEQPRTFGYHIGDKFARGIMLQLRQPYVLAANALPVPGRITEWLTLEAPQVTTEKLGTATRYDIRLTYQLVNVSPEPASIAVPHHDLSYSDGRETLQALIPATRVSVTALRDGTHSELQPDQRPTPLRFDYTRMSLSAVTLVLSVLALLYLYGGLPSRRTARPFAAAYRCIVASRRRGWGDEDYGVALRAVHHAFNETAGRTVFADTLGEFFAQCAPYALLELPVSEFYARSRGYFFAGLKDGPADRYSAQELAALVRKCRDVERGLV